MSRKDYVAVATVINNWYKLPASRTWAAAIGIDLADAFAASNPRFDRDKWFAAIREGVDA